MSVKFVIHSCLHKIVVFFFFGYILDFNIQVAQSIASVRQSVRKYQAVLWVACPVATTHENQKYFFALVSADLKLLRTTILKTSV